MIWTLCCMTSTMPDTYLQKQVETMATQVPAVAEARIMVLTQMTMMKRLDMRVMSRGQFRPSTSSQKPATQQCPPASLHLHHQEERHNQAPSCLVRHLHLHHQEERHTQAPSCLVRHLHLHHQEERHNQAP